MNINSIVKEEIIERKISNPCCKKAFLSGVIRGCGSLPIINMSFGLIIQNSSIELLEKCSDLIYYLTKTKPELRKVDKEISLGNRVVYELVVDNSVATNLLIDTGILLSPYEFNYELPENVKNKLCCRKSFLRGLFCASGTITLSEDYAEDNSKGYSLDITLTSVEGAEAVSELMGSLDILPSIREKRNTYSVYLKDSDKIGDFCLAMGSNNGFYALQEIVMQRSVRNDINRRTNCEVANIDRTLSASSKQIDAIELLESTGELQKLDEVLVDTALVRKQYPDACLNDLLEKLKFPTGKSGLNHRLRKLVTLAQGLKK